MPYKRLPILIIALWVFITPLYAQGKISGLMFGDYYYVAQSHDTINYKGQNGFWIRRIYLTYDYKISDEFSTRLRFEMQSPDFTKNSDKMIPVVRDAYLKWKSREHAVILGISPTPTAGPAESFWGYRAIEKTVTDLQELTSSREFGLAVKGKLGSGGVLGYHLMLGNGEGNKSENNKFKNILGGFYLKRHHFLIQVCGNWKDGGGHTDTYTYMGFGGFKSQKFKIGAQYARQIRQMEPDSQVSVEVLSGFSIFHLNKRTTFILRYDKMFDPSPSGISYIPFAQAKSNLLIGGIDLSPNKRVHFIPNVEYVFYNDTNGYRPDPDLYLKLTFYFKF